MNHRVFITGASGFIGRALTMALKNDPSCKLFLSARNKKIDDGEEVIFSDLSDFRSVEALISRVKPSEIYHIAGVTEENFESCLTGNVVTTHNLLEAVKNSGIKARILLMGTAAEYGKVFPEENPIKETHSLNPISFYALTKVYQTDLMKFYFEKFGMDIVMARTFNLSGAEASPQTFVGVMREEIKQYQAGTNPVIKIEHPEIIRDYLDVSDAVSRYRVIMKHGKKGEIYNVGSGVPTKLRDLLYTMLDQSGISRTSVFEEPSTSKMKVDIPVIYADITKLEKL